MGNAGARAYGDNPNQAGAPTGPVVFDLELLSGSICHCAARVSQIRRAPPRRIQRLNSGLPEWTGGDWRSWAQ